jgi:polysaccharide biosynthesis/export protein
MIALSAALAERGAAQVFSQGQSVPPAPSSANRQSGSISSGVMRNGELSVVPPDFASLKLAPGFLINLSVLDDPDFEGNFRVDQDGDVALPVLGVMRVAGETASDARQQIAKRLADDQILKDPQVNLTIIEYTAQEVTILGEVYSPGRYQLLAPRSLTDVLGLAGGLTVAAGNDIEISHGDKDAAPTTLHYSKATSAEVAHDTVIRPGDTVQVKRAGIVYVLGAVTRPGGYVMQEDGTLTALEAIALANGTTLPASVGAIDLIRRNPDGTAVRIELPLGKMQRGKHADMRLQATDILYVPNSKLKVAFTSMQGVLTAAASASIYAATIY